MKLKDGGMTVFIAILILGLCISMYGVITQPKEDGPLEEAGEALIFSATGVDIDFTPNSPE